MREMIRSFLCVALAGLTGCYSYALVPVESAPAGADVRARISVSEAERLVDVLGREDRVLEGELVGRENGGLLLQVRGPSAPRSEPLYQRVTLRPSVIQELEVRELDRWRTAGVVGAVLAAGILAVLQMSGDASEPTGGEGGGVDAVRIPWRVVP